jgi:hypothetical protein
MQPKTSDLRTIITRTAVISALKNGSDGTNDTDLEVVSTKAAILTATDKIDLTTTGTINMACSALTLTCGTNVARMSLTADNELVFEIKDPQSGTFAGAAKFVSSV